MSDPDKPSTIERALQLAREGKCNNMGDLRKILKAERYDSIESHLAGSAISRQLQALLRASRR